jgi:hypothetical protein
VRLSDEERGMCQEVIKMLKGSSQKARRAQILLKADVFDRHEHRPFFRSCHVVLELRPLTDTITVSSRRSFPFLKGSENSCVKTFRLNDTTLELTATRRLKITSRLDY